MVAALVLVSAAQPLFSDDAWWHLAMGAVYVESGLWLESDPLLHSAEVPPAAAAWLTDVALYGIERAAGFHGLRVTHALLVACFLGLGWAMLRRASASASFASLAMVMVVGLSAYRLFQLRPDLLTMLAALVLVGLLVSSREPPTWRSVTGSTALFVLWANLHGGFVLGLVLLAAALGGQVLALLLGLERSERARSRARRLAVALGAGFLGSLINPGGVRQLLLYVVAGRDTPALGVVADEWASVDLFAFPAANLPPTPLSWLLVWGLLVVSGSVIVLAVRRGRSAPGEGNRASADPALLAIAAVSLVGMLSAVRLLWLGIFVLIALGQAARGRLHGRDGPWATRAAALALLSLMLVTGFVRFGDWPLISRAIHRDWYGEPFAAIKYNTSAVWLLRDAEIEGNLFNDYTEGHFLAYWLSPRMRVFVNGSLNVPREVMQARSAILARRGEGAGFAELLDRHQIDVFFGSGMPVTATSTRAPPYTATHLERTAGWLLVFRNMRGALYLRMDADNASNLQRMVDYYARHGVPFDPERGFDPSLAIRDAMRWSVDNGVVPIRFPQIEENSRSLVPAQQAAARERLASIFLLIGLYERAERMDRRTLRIDPEAVAPARRLVWSLLHQGRYDDARLEAERLAARASPDDVLGQRLVAAARFAPDASDEQRRSIVATLPLFTPPELRYVTANLAVAEARPPPDRASPPGAVRPPDQ